MKRTIILSAFILLGFSNIYSQGLIALDHTGGGSEFFTRLDSAILHAQNGDYIYLPGTPGMNIGTITIDKGVHIIGAGTDPDSSITTGTTTLTGDLVILSGASNGSLQGFFLSGNITFGTNTNNQDISNYVISRCNLDNLALSFNGYDTAFSSILVRECIIRGSVSGGYVPAQFSNNIFEEQLNYFYGASFHNNIFLWGSNATINTNVRNTVFTNNIFANSCVAYFKNTYYNIEYCFNNNYYNNLFTSSLSFGIYQCCWAWDCNPDPTRNKNGSTSGNIESVPENNIYVNQSGYIHSYMQDYNLKPTSPGKNAGTDGTDVGIYGGSFPFKEGSLPVNPHIRFKNVAGSTNSNGTLDIHFKVAAQDK